MATITTRGTARVLNWSDASGQHRLSLGKISAKEANTILKAKEADLALGTNLLGLSSNGTNFDDFAERYLAWSREEHPSGGAVVASIITCHLKPLLRSHSLGSIRVEQVEALKQTLRRQGLATGTIINAVRRLKAMMNKAVEWGVLDKNQLAYAKPPKQLHSEAPKFYSSEDLQRIYEASPRMWPHVWRLMANTGLRRGEAKHLAWENVYADHISVVSTEEARTKSALWRSVPLSPTAKGALAALKLIDSQTIFEHNKKYVCRNYSDEYMTRMFQQHAEAAGVGGHLHMLRHTFISHMVMKGVDLRTIQVIAGHSSLSVTERYAHLAPGHLQSSVKDLVL